MNGQFSHVRLGELVLLFSMLPHYSPDVDNHVIRWQYVADG